MSKWIATPEAQRRVGCTYYAIKAAAAVGKVRILKPKNNVFAQWAGYLNVEAELKASTLFGMMDDLMGIRRWPIKHAPGLLSQL